MLKPSVTSKPGYPASSPAVTKTTTYTTSYVDVCETGLTTITATVTKTYTGVVPKPTSNEIPEGWYTTVTVCKHCGPVTTTVTLTKPYHTPTEAAYGAPSSPADQSAGKDSYPESKLPQAAYVPGIASGEESVSVTSKVYMPVVPAPASEAPAYEATPAPYVPISSTAAYVPSGMASSTIKGAAASTGAHGPSYTPPLFEGAASRFGVGMSGVVGLVAGVLLL
ncbi:hypothetical protein P171DRAFT_489154 [Karstenula rhodostoma CBS 690.94]|uniref:Uncharacterized protein n=1 Tax=Karstenula rhodostoma CBS 690.94 TaxID=1392251 RepID=A0A9P4PCE6_9PLEO|nr:hypothetical protein P171DRAFT_489154 [Karstenula rhodostoma CBS 690.94]